MKIKLPKNPLNPEDIKSKNRGLLTFDFEKNGILCNTLVFTKINEPVSNEDLKDIMQQYYGIEVDKSKIKIATKRLNDLGMLNSITSGDLTTMPPNERTGIYNEAYIKFFRYLDHIPRQFRKNYDKLTYYWVANGMGLEYLEWACKLLKIEVED